jgi:hypothetical protein
VGNPFQNDSVVVESGVTRSAVQQSDTAVLDDIGLQPFEPDQRIFWAIRRGVRAALGDSTWSDLQAALPDPASFTAMEPFIEGVAAGVRDTIADVILQFEKLLVQGGGLTIAFYKLVFNTDFWVELAEVYSGNTDISEFGQYLQTNYPMLYKAIMSLPKLQASFSRLVESLTTKDARPPWPAAAWAIAEWAVAVAPAIGGQLQPEIANLVAAKGNPADQGQIIGKVVSNVVIQVVFIVSGLFGILQGVLGVARPILIGIRLALAETRGILIAAQLTAKVAPEILKAGEEAAQGVKQAVKIYGDLAYKISPYKNLRLETAAFNQTVRDVAGYGKYDMQYGMMRLDAHHFVENTWYDDFAADFKKVFGWQSADDMDTIAVHTEWHIRSGEKLGDLGYLGAENEKSLTKALQDYLEHVQIGPDGKPKPFQSLRQLIEANRDFYKNYSSPLWKKVEPWFTQALVKLTNAGL